MSYVPTSPEQRRAMLEACGVQTVEDLFRDIPAELRPRSFRLPAPLSEIEVLARMRELAARNYSHLTNFMGGGFYDHFIPAAVDAVVSRSEFYTSYTPYQPELSQGTLQAIYEYQTHICRLTGLDASNASLYDGGTALYEACQMALHATDRNRIVIDGGVNPVYRKILESYTANLSLSLHQIAPTIGPADRAAICAALDEDTAALVLQNPNFFGVVDNHADLVAECHRRGILVIQSVYPIALACIRAPGEIGVDIAVGEGQSLGIPLAFGGPYLGFLATTRSMVRRMPGRLVGRTVDRDGREAFVLTLQAREQHIRREKAVSNICTNEALCALRAHVYLSLLGKRGLQDVARLCRAKTHYAMQRLRAIPGLTVYDANPVFNEFVVTLPVDAGELAGRMVEHGIAPGLPLGRFYDGFENCLLIAVTEKRSRFEIGTLAEALEATLCR